MTAATGEIYLAAGESPRALSSRGTITLVSNGGNEVPQIPLLITEIWQNLHIRAKALQVSDRQVVCVRHEIDRVYRLHGGGQHQKADVIEWVKARKHI